MRILLALTLAVLTTGCMSVKKYNTHVPPAPVSNALQREFDSLPGPVGEPVTVAVYSFTDKTGQRKSTGGNVAATSFSS